MSVHAVSWAFKQDIRPSARKFILVALANYADEEGVCYPSQKTLAGDTGQSERSVREHLAALEADGVLVRVARRRENGTWRSDCFQIVREDSQPQKSSGAREQTKNQRRNSPSAKSAAGETDKPSKSATSTHRQISPAANSADGENFRNQRQISPSHIRKEPSVEPKGESSLRSDSCPNAVRTHPTKKRIAYSEKFEDGFWRPYPTDPNMSKRKAWDQFQRLSPEDQDRAIQAVPLFLAYCRERPDYRPVHAERFLSHRRFDGFLDAAKTHYQPQSQGDASASRTRDYKRDYSEAIARAKARSLANSGGSIQ